MHLPTNPIAVVGIVAVFALTATMLKAWLKHQENMRRLGMTTQGLGSSEQRLQRLEQAVDAIAIEVERISEGQRYVTRLLSERGQSTPYVAPPQPPRVDTPH